MKLFIDTADIDEIRTVAGWGVLDGVTTNPSLFARTTGKTYEEVLREICQITAGPVSAKVVAEDVDGMPREGRHFAKLADNICGVASRARASHPARPVRVTTRAAETLSISLPLTVTGGRDPWMLHWQLGAQPALRHRPRAPAGP